ncbi:hypothetical protein [Streptomyces sp. NPDC058486]|uniref:hypothetical protein n=1 Tax=unclassified Streptomyces TaxID=2593676 RepID=UPI0036533D68
MVFDNIFGAAGKGAGLFSVTTEGTKPRPGRDIDFEDCDETTYDDTTTSLFTSAIHGADSRAKTVREDSPESRVILGFLGSFVRAAQASGEAQARYAADPGSVSSAAAAGMRESGPTVTQHDGLQRDEDLADRPRKADFTKPPEAQAPKTPQTPQAQAPEPPKPAKPATPTADTPPTPTADTPPTTKPKK